MKKVSDTNVGGISTKLYYIRQNIKRKRNNRNPGNFLNEKHHPIIHGEAKVYPYLTFKDKLTQVWINQYTLLLLLICVKICLFSFSLKSSLSASESSTTTTCNLIDKYASNIISVPHYTAKTANALIYKGVQETNYALVEGLKLLVTGVEEILIFYIEVMLGTYVCLLTAAIDSTVDIATNTTESIIDLVNNTLISVTNEIDDGLNDLSKVINNVESLGESFVNLFSGNDNNQNPLKTVNLTVASLRNISIPSSINTDLEKLAKNTPNFDTVESKTTQFLRDLFDFLYGKLIDNNTEFIGEADSLSVPELKSAQICPSQLTIHNIFFDAGNTLETVLKVILVVLVIISIIIMVPLSYLEYRKWRKVEAMTCEISDLQNSLNLKPRIYDVIDKSANRIQYLVSQAFTKLIKSPNQNQRNAIRWMTTYSLTPSSLLLLGIAMAGILAVILQHLILFFVFKCLKKGLSEFNKESTDLQSVLKTAVSDWTNSTNTYLSSTESSINDGLLGMVYNATETVNTTISEFYDDVNDEITKIFNNTLFEDPVRSIVKCVIGNKIEAVEKGLTWVHNHALVTLPRVEESYLLNSSNSNSTDNEMFDKVKGFLKDTVATIVAEYKKSIMIELIISLVLLGVFLLQILISWGILWLKKKNFLDNSDGFGDDSDRKTCQTQQCAASPIISGESNPFDDRFRLAEHRSEKTLYSSSGSFWKGLLDNFDTESSGYNRSPTKTDASEYEFEIIKPPPVKYRKVDHKNPFNKL